MKKKLIAVLILLALPITVYSAEIGIGGLIFAGKTDSPATCNAALEGGLYYDDSENALKVCDGSSWAAIGGGGGGGSYIERFEASYITWYAAGRRATLTNASRSGDLAYIDHQAAAYDDMVLNTLEVDYYPGQCTSEPCYVEASGICGDNRNEQAYWWTVTTDVKVDKCYVYLMGDNSPTGPQSQDVTIEFLSVTWLTGSSGDADGRTCGVSAITNGLLEVNNIGMIGNATDDEHSDSAPTLMDFSSEPTLTAGTAYMFRARLAESDTDSGGGTSEVINVVFECEFDIQ